MTPRAWWILAAFFILIFYGLARLFSDNSIYRPYEKPVPIPAKVISSALAKHGPEYTMKTVPEGLYFERDGETIWVLRR